MDKKTENRLPKFKKRISGGKWDQKTGKIKREKKSNTYYWYTGQISFF